MKFLPNGEMGFTLVVGKQVRRKNDMGSKRRCSYFENFEKLKEKLGIKRSLWNVLARYGFVLYVDDKVYMGRKDSGQFNNMLRNTKSLTFKHKVFRERATAKDIEGIKTNDTEAKIPLQAESDMQWPVNYEHKSQKYYKDYE